MNPNDNDVKVLRALFELANDFAGTMETDSNVAQLNRRLGYFEALGDLVIELTKPESVIE